MDDSHPQILPTGGPFTLVTDHTPLQWLVQMKDTNPRLSCWYLTLQNFAFIVQYIEENEHTNVDYFSQQGPSARSKVKWMVLSDGVCVRLEVRVKPLSRECHPSHLQGNTDDTYSPSHEDKTAGA